FIFFFQAEDGIRDFHVTGVQTCALPIYKQRTQNFAGRGHFKLVPPGNGMASQAVSDKDYRTPCSGYRGIQLVDPCIAMGLAPHRSEERRVGKECRSRCSAYHWM